MILISVGMAGLQLGREETTGNNCKWTGFVGSTVTTCCDGGDPAVWFTTLTALCEQPNGRVCVKDAGRGRVAPIFCMDG